MDNNPIHLTILRRGDVHIVDLAEVQAIIPRSETRVEGSFLEEISQELKRITNVVGPQFRASVAAADSGTRLNPGVVDDLKDLGSLIFSHLLPIEARNKLRDAGPCNLYLRLDDQLVHLPWELAFDGQQFLGMKFSVGRQVITHHRAAQASPIRAKSEILRVLIISDPSETLQNVSRESEQLCEILDEVPGLQVRLLGGRNVKRIPLLAALRQSDIVHFAGHSQFDEKNPEKSGWLLHDGLLSASEISKLDQAPLLVFSNSCQAGATKNWQGNYLYEGEAFGLGSAFLLAGVRNFVGTFCVIHDEESRFLAVEFYKRVAEGRSIGQALLDARRATASAMGFDRLTWASYMLYGDPAFSLSHATKSEVQPAIEPAEARVSAFQVQPPTFLSAAESKRGRFKWPRLSLKISISFTVGMLAVLVFGHLLRTEHSIIGLAPTEHSSDSKRDESFEVPRQPDFNKFETPETTQYSRIEVPNATPGGVTEPQKPIEQRGQDLVPGVVLRDSKPALRSPESWIGPPAMSPFIGQYEIRAPASVYSQPREDSARVAQIAAGTRINVVGVRGEWLEVRSMQGRPPGFIKKDSAVAVVSGQQGKAATPTPDTNAANSEKTPANPTSKKAAPTNPERTSRLPQALRDPTLATSEKLPALPVNKEMVMPIPPPADISDLKAERPEWKVGYEWTYAFKETKRSGAYTTEVVRDEVYDGVPMYVLKTATYEYWFTRDNLSFVAMSSKDEAEYKKDPPEQYFSWPLAKEKQWRNSFRFGIPKDKYWETAQTRLVVTAVENVQVPAGTFLAFKIVHYDQPTNKIIAERWYSPEVKWYVKQKEYDKETGVREVELTRFKIN